MTSSHTDLASSKRGYSHTMSIESLEALANTHVVLSAKNLSTLETTNAAVNQINDSVQAFGTTANASHQSTLLSLEQLGDKMQHLSGLSIAQSENLNATCNAILELLKQQLPAKPHQSATEAFQHEAVRPGAVEDSEEMKMEAKAHDSSGDNNDLQHALDRLCHFAKQKEKTVFSEEAETILHNIQHIFELLLEAEEEECGEKRKGKRLWDLYEEDITDDHQLYQHEAKRIKGLLSASHCISINEKGQYEIYLGVPIPNGASSWE